MRLGLFLFAAFPLLCSSRGNAQGLRSISSLKVVKVPTPSNLDRYVRDNAALVVLGKTFFWDVQASSDGRVACVTCHFHAGADHRVQNQLAPPPGVTTPITPDQILTLDMFPFRKLADVKDRQSAVMSEVRQTVGSAGRVPRPHVGRASRRASGSAVE